MRIAKNKLLKKILPFLLPAVAFIAALLYFLNNYDEFREIRIDSWWWVFLLLISLSEKLIPAALVLKKILSFFQVRIKYWEAASLVLASGMGNFFVPYVGGLGLRGTYLRTKYGLALPYFAGTAGAALLLSTLVNAVFGLSMVVYLWGSRGLFNPVIFLLFAGFILVVAFFVLSPFGEIKSDNKIIQKVNKVGEGWKTIRSQGNRSIILLLLLSVISSLFNFTFTYFAFRAVTDNISIPDAVIIGTMTSLSRKVSFTPAGLGIRELVTVFTAQALGYVLVVSITVAVIKRIVSTAIFFIGGGVSSYALFRPSARKNMARE